ncbi:hypothetical protein Nit79A3_1466 [Nitrosomonas sp. Is79A3]|uniref:DUF2958 domain-containing protein n=1 Tax=Nitrosomonas sp. (strain Is79A3) TaxID=261292 RepID=UPI000215D0D8
MMNSVYKVFTPAGQFDAIFAEDEDIPLEYSGDEPAISFFKDWLFINQVSGEHGHLLDSENLTPRDLYGFCQPRGGVIEVMPPFEDLLAYIQEDAANQAEDNFEQLQEENTMHTLITNDSAILDDVVKIIGDATLDGISGIEKIKLIKEAGSIRANLQTVQSGIEKHKMVKRIKEIRDALGVGDGLGKDGLDADGMWPMTRAEYDKIHSDYKGAFPDGTPTALKLINGGTSIVPVRITDEQPKAQEPEVKPQVTIEDVNKVMPLLKQFIGKAQLSAIGMGIRGEEGQFFKDKLIEIANVIQTMPKTYGQDGMGDKAIAYLHYFKGAGDWHITEKDMEDEQLQAFGLANIGYGGELGYISIQELIDAGVELDLYWTPKTIGEIKGGSSEDENQGTETGGDETGGESTEIPQSTEEPQTITPADTIKAGFVAELEALKSETDINRFNERLDEIAARIEQAGLMESLDKELNDAADVLTRLLYEAEKGV